MTAGTLFALLDGCLESDAGPAGFRGKIGVGVLSARGPAWWVCDFTDTSIRYRSAAFPEDCAAALLMGQTEVCRLLDGQDIGRNPTIQIFGDRGLLLRFLERYVKREEALGLQMAGLLRRRQADR